MTNQQLARTSTPAQEGLITTHEDYRARLQIWQAEHYHVLSPVANFSVLPAQHGLMPVMVQIDPDPDHQEVYFNSQFCERNEVALAKVGLRKIATCAGYKITTERVDNKRRPAVEYYWEFQATATWTGLDGAQEMRQTTQDWDLKDGSFRLKGFSVKQTEEARKHGLRNCETRAINAVIRELGVRQKYTKAELAKPFVVVRVMFQPDMSDPEIRRMAAASHFGAVGALYPQSAIATSDPIDVTPEGGGSDPLAGLPTADAPASAEPAEPAGTTVTFVGTHPSRKGVFVIRTAGAPDRDLHTDDRDIATAAKVAMDAQSRVDITADRGGAIVEMESREELKL